MCEIQKPIHDGQELRLPGHLLSMCALTSDDPKRMVAEWARQVAKLQGLTPGEGDVVLGDIGADGLVPYLVTIFVEEDSGVLVPMSPDAALDAAAAQYERRRWSSPVDEVASPVYTLSVT